MAKTCERAKIRPPYPSSLCSETEAKIHVFCINCESKSALGKRDWQGRIIGKGLHGSLNALCTRIKHKYKSAPLMRLLTVCIDCCAELELYHEADQIGQIFGFKDNNTTPGEMVLRISYKEIEEIVSSKVIIMEGWLLNANVIETVGVNGEWRKWYLWFKN
ncbi:hypothetical protein B0J14DRAFT_567113 [Halenospora varia]|nr:hypothetical protein B0J14DRAFT_567113 [Halenospora varia]